MSHSGKILEYKTSAEYQFDKETNIFILQIKKNSEWRDLWPVEMDESRCDHERIHGRAQRDSYNQRNPGCARLIHRKIIDTFVS